MRKLNNQNGFGAVEVLLVVLVLLLTVGVGLYGYNTIKDKDSDTAKNGETTSSTKKVQTQKVYVELPDLGIKFPKTDAMKNLSYRADPSVAMTVYIHDEKYDEIARSCGTSTTAVADASMGAIGTHDGVFNQEEAFGSQLVKQFDTFYVSVGYPNGGSPCEDETKQIELRDIAKKSLDAVNESLKSVEKL